MIWSVISLKATVSKLRYILYWNLTTTVLKNASSPKGVDVKVQVHLVPELWHQKFLKHAFLVKCFSKLCMFLFAVCCNGSDCQTLIVFHFPKTIRKTVVEITIGFHLGRRDISECSTLKRLSSKVITDRYFDHWKTHCFKMLTSIFCYRKRSTFQNVWRQSSSKNVPELWRQTFWKVLLFL